MDEEIPEAIPGCMTWRINNPEPALDCSIGKKLGLTPEQLDNIGHKHVAPYCPSAYCDRCRYLRTQDGVPTIKPNEWMERS
jgi:hypothetical protein